MKKIYTSKYFKDRFPQWKKERDSLMDRFLYRRISYFVSALCANCNISANCVSNFSVFIGILTCVLISIPNHVIGIIGAILLVFWIILDDTDGNLARCVQKQPYGEYLDAMSSYILIGILFFSLGIRSFYTTDLFKDHKECLIIIGAITSISGILMSLLYQKFILVSQNYGKNEKLEFDFSNSSRLMILKTKIDLNLSVGGIIPFLVIIAIILEKCEYIVLFWCVYYFFELIATIFYFNMKVRRACLKGDSNE